ncbi:hypothetical protein VPHD480_0170 [Vibrio phage D480]
MMKTTQYHRILLETLAIDFFSNVEVSYSEDGSETYTSGTTKFQFNDAVEICIMTKAGTPLNTTDETKIEVVINSLLEKAREERYMGI